MNILQPLIDKADAVTREANQLHDAVKQCHDFIGLMQLVPCPRCALIGYQGEPNLVSVPPTIDAPSAHGIAVRCDICGIQTAPEYWHLSQPEASPYSALYDTFEAWGYTEIQKQKAVAVLGTD